MEFHQLSQQEVQALVAKAQQGDTDAFGQIYDAYLTPVYRYTVFRMPQELAEDTVADIFVKAWEKIHTYTPFASVPFGAWLFRIARHTIIDSHRRTRDIEEISEELPDEDRWNDPKLRTEQNLSVEKVRLALKKLPRFYREVILLHYVSGLTHAEIARSMHLTEGAVRILKFRALKKLKPFLGDATPDIP